MPFTIRPFRRFPVQCFVSYSTSYWALFLFAVWLTGCGHMNMAQSDQVTVDAQANLVTLHFNAALRTDEVITGTFTYESTIGPNATNVRNRSPNVLYRLTAWNFVVESGIPDLPSTTYRNDEPGNTAEFCEGVCILSSTSYLELRFANTGTTVLSLLFGVNDPTPFINPPSGLAEWGAMVQSTYRIPCPICGPLAGDSDGNLDVVSGCIS
jgi:hypothetical protein